MNFVKKFFCSRKAIGLLGMVLILGLLSELHIGSLEGHNDAFRTAIRRTLRNGLGLDQGRAQEWAEEADYWVDCVITNMVFSLAMSGTLYGIAAGVGLTVAIPKSVCRCIIYNLYILLPEEAESEIINNTSEIADKRP